MSFRTVLGVLVGIFVYVIVTFLVGNYLFGYEAGVQNPLLRLPAIFVGLTAAFTVYSLIKGDEPEPETKEKKGITNDEISKKLAERRKRVEK